MTARKKPAAAIPAPSTEELFERLSDLAKQQDAIKHELEQNKQAANVYIDTQVKIARAALSAAEAMADLAKVEFEFSYGDMASTYNADEQEWQNSSYNC